MREKETVPGKAEQEDIPIAYGIMAKLVKPISQSTQEYNFVREKEEGRTRQDKPKPEKRLKSSPLLK
ncbi:MAG TPA: hypothetical protein PKM25_10775 [Candidatus Ozemobacteraceae bacterium]|nr:hypothetical protein [Candidatus Ozemobacteraceae bacterium]